jgi:DNA-binding response OmpR family regulator
MTSPKRILLVEDDENLGFVVKDNLELIGYKVDLAADGQEGLNQFLNGHYHLCILDIMLPRKDGFELAAIIRKANPSIPLVFLTARSLKEDNISGFQMGADDYITKPFSVEELELRVQALMKRAYETEEEVPDIFEVGKCTFDYNNMLLTCSGKEQRLTAKEGKLLRLLCMHKNEVLRREDALEAVWGENDYFAGRSMDVFISRLRKYLSDDPNVSIENVHGVGFRLTDDGKSG